MACTQRGVEVNQGEVIASVGSATLTQSDLIRLIPPATEPEDSARIADQIVNTWIREQCVVQMAEENLPDTALNFQAELDRYRKSLVIYAYERALVSEKLDTVITEAEMENYYKQNKDDFQLRDYLIKVIYLKVNQEAPRQRQVAKWLENATDENLNKLEEYAFQYAENYFVNVDNWLFLDDLIKELPGTDMLRERLLTPGQPLELEEGDYKYFVRVIDVRLKDGVAPLSVVREDIRSIILNSRKVELVAAMRNEAFVEAEKKGLIKRSN